MRDSVVTSKGSRSRRTIATLTWVGLTSAAAILWYARLYGTIRGSSSEAVALLLSGYAAFSSIFAWMLFSPNRRSPAASATLFLTGGITLLPPCIISFCLMPVDSPLRGWVTLGVFVLMIIAIMSPVPEEFFAVPRDRSSYLQPVSETLFARLRTADVASGFDQLALIDFPQQSSHTEPQRRRDPPVEWFEQDGDPWQDPFRGTGIQPVRPGSRTSQRSGTPTEPADCAPVRPPARPPARAAQSAVERPAAAFGFRAPVVTEQNEQRFTARPAAVPLAESTDRLERTVDELGGEMIEGTRTVVFEAGQKRANLHVAFSPPLPGIPEVECEAVGEEALRLKVPARQPYGIRIEARRSDASKRLETEIGFAAVCAPRTHTS